MATLNPKKNKSNIITVRFSDEEKAKILALQQKHGYRSISSLLRALLFEKRMHSDRRKEIQGPDVLNKRIAELIYNVKKIGINYNQAVAQYHKLAKVYEGNKDNYYLTIIFTRLQETLESLHKETTKMMDEFNFLLRELTANK